MKTQVSVTVADDIK